MISEETQKEKDAKSLKKHGVKFRHTSTGHTIAVDKKGKVVGGNPNLSGSKGNAAKAPANSSSDDDQTDSSDSKPKMSKKSKKGFLSKLASMAKGVTKAALSAGSKAMSAANKYAAKAIRGHSGESAHDVANLIEGIIESNFSDLTENEAEYVRVLAMREIRGASMGIAESIDALIQLTALEEAILYECECGCDECDDDEMDELDESTEVVPAPLMKAAKRLGWTISKNGTYFEKGSDAIRVISSSDGWFVELGYPENQNQFNTRGLYGHQAFLLTNRELGDRKHDSIRRAWRTVYDLITGNVSEAARYEGPALEKGGTSISGKAAPSVRAMLGSQIKPGMRVLDYGAGKYARNADFLREAGVDVYAYDPYNGKPAVDGWQTGVVSNRLPPAGTGFDLAFTAYVLNVVPEHIEDDIIADLKRYSSKQVHITRNVDIADTVKKALLRGDSLVTNFYLDHFAPKYAGAAEELESTGGDISKEMLMAFCEHGVETSKGFQRIPMLENKGFKRTKKSTGYKVFEK